MNTRKPVFTESAECQDCYKCVRGCPVKAIRVRNGHASVEPETCVYCGKCVSLCPSNAKRIRNDLPRVRQLLSLRSAVYASLAPSFVGEFGEYSAGQLEAALRRLGFAGVSETALGAELVTAETDRWFAEAAGGLQISTACPVMVDLITKYYPGLAGYLSSAPSPMMAHAAYLREQLGDEIAVVFIGPCIAKKCESDADQDTVDAAITFSDLRRWLTEAGVDPADEDPERAPRFVPQRSSAGRFYPVDGGMSKTLSLDSEERFARCMDVSGIPAVRDTLDGLDPKAIEGPLFLELLACEGGCINGPGTTDGGSLLQRRSGVTSFAAKAPRNALRDGRGTRLPSRWQPAGVTSREVSEAEIRKALRQVGKRSREDELNCGGCGYDSCRHFARALVAGRAEPAMCVAYMRRLAQKKNSALLKTMPSAAVTVDANLRIVESNRNFARLCGEEAEQVYETSPGLEGAMLDRFVPQTELFQAVLHQGGEVTDKTLRINGAIVNASIFSIEDHHLVGAILQDITDPAMRKQQIVEKSKEVIDKNLQTVQQIAYLLGENASETELILNSIVRSFSGEDGE